MNIEKTYNDGNVIIKPEGRLDSLTAGTFEEAVNSVIDDTIKSLTIDMKQVDFISSKGLRVLVGAYKKLAGKPISLNGVNPSVYEVLKLSNLLGIFNINQ